MYTLVATAEEVGGTAGANSPQDVRKVLKLQAWISQRIVFQTTIC